MKTRPTFSLTITGKIGECGYTICFVRTSDSIFVNENKALNLTFTPLASVSNAKRPNF